MHLKTSEPRSNFTGLVLLKSLIIQNFYSVGKSTLIIPIVTLSIRLPIASALQKSRKIPVGWGILVKSCLFPDFS